MVMNALETDPEFTLHAVPSQSGGDAEDPAHASTPRRRTINPAIVAVCVLALAIGAAALYFLGPRSEFIPPKAAPAESEMAPASRAQPEAAVEYPVEKIPAAADVGLEQAPLPTLDASDDLAKDVIGAILDGEDLVRLLVPTSIIRHIVATIDNLPRTTLAAQINPLRPVPGSFATTDTAHGIAATEINAQRYAAYVLAAESIDTKRLVGFYVRLYPLLQQAYVELGYPRGYFNDRLISVIDHLLAAPEPAPPFYLVQPKVRFEFADAELERISAGQKILVRIGLDNEMRLKAKLRDIRRALTAQATHP